MDKEPKKVKTEAEIEQELAERANKIKEVKRTVFKVSSITPTDADIP